ncbi:hypothetical protein CAPTEDRAFT_206022 [Capitella teleta]|uniref:Uncharacterized protein n=1 Tax=Capitella teleta TaxID=283909 RepID=R7U2V8_CAPTE|nr:hypothetical protein CAPTEDRAFT_206022 [Capitella teleta]|eukprot:ELU00685.1 hypothetical protein CAPTEDRAFT_206022 [Capitella teleta]
MGLPEAQKARRAAARWLTVSTRDLEEGLKQADEVGPASEDRLVLRRKLQALLKEFEPLLETWCVAQGNVEEAIVDDEALDKDIDASFAFKRSVLTTRNAAQSWIERLSPPNAQFDDFLWDQANARQAFGSPN